MIKKNNAYNKFENYSIVIDYCNGVLNGTKPVNKEQVQGVERFEKSLKDERYDFRPSEPEKIIHFIESTIVHQKGESIDGTPLRGTPFLLMPWHKFIIYDLLGFWMKDSKILRFHESFIFIPRKNTKTTFASALAWALSIYFRQSGSTCYIVANAMNQSRQSFDFLKYNIEQMGEEQNFKIMDSNIERSITREFKNGGALKIQALAASVDRQDSLNCNIAIADELHSYRTPKQYNIIKEAMKAYSNKLMIGISTAGDNMNSFCYNRLKYCKRVLDGSVEDEQYHIYIAKADEAEEGYVDYTNPLEHEKANPMYGQSIRPNDILNDSMQAQNDPQGRKDFLAKSLNIFTSSTKSYFNMDVFRESDQKYKWTLDELAKLPIQWFGGADLAKMHDLTATALHGTYKDVDISITHAFFPVTKASLKADEDNIPLYGWMDEGFLTMTNSAITDYTDVIAWFVEMRKKGFKIKQIGFDRKFAEEFYLGMKRERFNVVDEPQLYINKSKGFRRIEQKAIAGKFYYLHSSAYEYCLENVHAVEKTDDMIQYEKIHPNMRIDLFDADVFATCRMINNLEKANVARKWLDG